MMCVHVRLNINVNGAIIIPLFFSIYSGTTFLAPALNISYFVAGSMSYVIAKAVVQKGLLYYRTARGKHYNENP
jgi:hypothetical protein